MKRGVALTILAALSTASGAQEQPEALRYYDHTSWGTEVGIPASGILTAARGADGYVWLSVGRGALRFDGLRFTLIDRHTAPALCCDSVGTDRLLPLFVDGRGSLWFAKTNGALITYRDGVFTRIRAAGKTDDGAASYAQDGAGGVWHASGAPESRLDEIEPSADTIPAQIRAQMPHAGITRVQRDTGRGIWLGTRKNGLWHVTRQGVEHLDAPWSAGAPPSPLLQSRDGTLWVSGGLPDLWRVRDGVWSVVRFPGLDHVAPRAVVEDSQGAIWIGTSRSGVWRVLGSNVEQLSRVDGLTSANVTALIPEPEGGMWVATSAGLDRLRPKPYVMIDRLHGLPFDVAERVLTDATGTVWASSNTGVVARLSGGVVRGQLAPPAIETFIPPGVDAYTLQFAGRDSTVWFSNVSGTVIRGWPRTRSVDAALPAASAPLVASLRDDAGRLWVARNEGDVGRIEANRFVPFTTPDGERPRRPWLLEPDPMGGFWLSTLQPTALFHVGADTTRRWDTRTGLPPGPVVAMAPGRSGTLWAVAGGGTQVIRLKDGRVSTILTAKEVVGVFGPIFTLVTAGDFLWLGGREGIGRLPLSALERRASGDRAALTPQMLAPKDGLSVGAAHGSTVARGPDGRLWFVTLKGIAVVDPTVFDRKPSPPTPIIEEVVVNDTLPYSGRDVRVAPNPVRVEIHFTAARPMFQERVQLQYRLDGVDRDWVNSSSSRTATYTLLRPASYRFHVRARDGDGPWAQREAAMSLEVVPAWYQTMWFVTLSIVAAVGLTIAGIFGAQHQRAKRANERVQARFDAVLSERTRLARELHDTLLQSFTGVSLQLDALRRRPSAMSPDAAGALANILTVTDHALREARQAVWELRAPLGDGRGLVQALDEAVRRVVGTRELECNCRSRGRARQLAPDVETTVMRVGVEAVANAVKHSDARTIDVELAYEDGNVCLRVHDDGRGLPPSAADAARAAGRLGLVGMQERAARLGGTFRIESAEHKGTTIVLSLPADLATPFKN